MPARSVRRVECSRSVVLAHNEVDLHIMDEYACREHVLAGRHIHCYRCQTVLKSMDRVAKFRNGGRAVVTKNNLAKYFCLPCGKLLTDSTVRIVA